MAALLTSRQGVHEHALVSCVSASSQLYGAKACTLLDDVLIMCYNNGLAEKELAKCHTWSESNLNLQQS